MKRSKLLTIPRAATRMLLATLLLTMTVQTAWADDVNIEATGQNISDATTWENCTVNITGSNKVNFYKRITISGAVTLNLGAGATLNAPYGITVNQGNSLTIAGDGSLYAGADGLAAAAIGGIENQNSGTINITGGTINATSYAGGAGIGGGRNGSATIINISGGNVTATGSGWSAGIGGGLNGSAGTITITGGVVNATGIYCGAGIGGGGSDSTNPGSGGNITISGGQVTATGGMDYNTPCGYGIGPGKDDNKTTDGRLGTLSLSWTENTDFINASSYKGTISFEDGKRFYYDGTTDYVTADELANKLNQKIVPAVADNNSLAFADIQMPRYYITTNGTAVDVSYDVYDYNGNKLTQGTHYTAVIKNSSNEEVSTFDQLGDYTLTVTGTTYTGSKSFTFSLVEWDTNLSVDGSDHYINFPSDGTKKTVYLGAGQTIKVYDSEGKNGNLVPSDGSLMLYAPEGYALEVTGKTDAQYYSSGKYLTWLKAYDGNDETETALITKIDQNNDNISFASAADGMLMRFYVYNGESAKEKYGLDLTVRVVEATPHNITVGTADNGSIASDKTSAKTNETVTLTVTPASGYLLKRITVTDTDNSTTIATIGEDHWYSGGNTVTYKMPNKNIKFTPEFANILSADDGLTLNIDPIRTTEYVIPEGVQSFNIKGSANNSSTVTAILKAPEGVRLLATIDNCEIYYSNSYISVYDGTGSSSTLIKQLTTNDASISPQTSTAEYMTFEIYGVANTRLNGKIEMVYSINYDLAGGSVATENPATYTYDTNAFTLTNPTRTGYEFTGWTGTGLDAASTNVTIVQGTTGNRSYTATWTPISYSISYNGVEGATNPNPANYTIESEAITLNAPTKDGYTFAGWFDNAEFTGSAVTTITAGSTGDKTFWAKWIQDLTYGGVTIKDNGTTKSATMDASQVSTISITSDVVVNTVELNRDFTANQPATVMLPFSLSDGQTVSGGSFYKFSGVTKNGDEWKAQFTEVATLKANTPYLFMPSATGQMAFNLNGGTVTLNTTTTGEAGSTASNWEFCGTYQKVQWDGSASDPSDLSKTYGFAKGDATIAAGQFVHFAAGAWLKPMRCYLVYNGSTEGGTFQNAPSRTRGAASTEELPQTITVVLLSSSGETTGIGTLDTKTGDISLDGWYTMDGRKLEGKPTKKGLYINNGRKIVIK